MVGGDLFCFPGSEEFLPGFTPLSPETSIRHRRSHYLGEEKYAAYNKRQDSKPYFICLATPPGYHLLSSSRIPIENVL
ncbi:MAG TPA: hypothetical protein VMW39_03230 [bacterium]|nr:hypothetical protein [bacterium]